MLKVVFITICYTIYQFILNQEEQSNSLRTHLLFLNSKNLYTFEMFILLGKIFIKQTIEILMKEKSQPWFRLLI